MRQPGADHRDPIGPPVLDGPPGPMKEGMESLALFVAAMLAVMIGGAIAAPILSGSSRPWARITGGVFAVVSLLLGLRLMGTGSTGALIAGGGSAALAVFALVRGWRTMQRHRNAAQG